MDHQRLGLSSFHLCQRCEIEKMQYASLSTSQLSSWALLNNIELYGLKVESDIFDEDGSSKGGGLVATAEHSGGEPILTVPHDIVISKEQISNCARADATLRELLATLADSDLANVGHIVIYNIHYAELESRGRLQDTFTDLFVLADYTRHIYDLPPVSIDDRLT